MKQKAVCLVSGGLDSCVTTAIAAERYEIAMLHVNYGQRTEKRELMAFEDIADYYNVDERLVADISYLKTIGGSALTDEDISVPLDALDDSEIPVTYVPFRNTHILAVAVSWAEVTGASAIFIGATEVDSSGYPDCRKSYYKAFEALVREGTRPETVIKIETPLIEMTKREVVRTGVEKGAPLHLTWSCYRDEKVACGRCDSCLLRLRGFSEAGITDPVIYAP
jgi:7-cyano-7-deazaguanine synthase